MQSESFYIYMYTTVHYKNILKNMHKQKPLMAELSISELLLLLLFGKMGKWA